MSMSIDTLKYRQGQNLQVKEILTEARIREFYEHYNGKVYISLSGGKDSTVLLDIARKMYPDIPAVFVDTGLEYPEIRSFVKTIDNVLWLKPKKPFRTILTEYGFPVISKEVSQKIHEYRHAKTEGRRYRILHGNDKGKGKITEKWKFLLSLDIPISHRCCYYMKKEPLYRYEKETGNKAIVGTMAEESRLRLQTYLKRGCNSFEGRGMSTPLGFWLEKDIWAYVHKYSIPYSSIYDMGYRRTGCMFCMFGIQFDTSPNRFQRMAETHPKQYEYCMEYLGLRQVCTLLQISTTPSKYTSYTGFIDIEEEGDEKN